MERIPPIESPKTPEKSRDELYFDALKSKRDVLSSHYALNQLRKGKKIEEMSDTKIEDYKSVKREYDKRKELFLASFAGLSEEDGQRVAELTSLTKIEIELSKLERPAGADAGATRENIDHLAVEIPARQTAENIAGETRIHREEPSEEKPVKSDRTKELEHILAEKYERLHQDVSVIDRRPLEEEIRALEAEKNISEAELLERQDAEANPDRPAPRGFLQKVRDSYEKTKEAIMGANRISGGSETVESRMSPLSLRKEAMESASPREAVQLPQPETTSQQPEKEPKKDSWWGFIKERAKGYLTFGLWELHQAERFRSKTKEVANDTKALATLIQQERNLNLEEAEKEAWEIVEELKKNNLDISAPEFYQANKDITERKRKENDEEIEYIIKSAGEDLRAKLGIGKGAFKEYRGWLGKGVLNKEDELAFEADLRGELSKMRDGAMRKDFINFAKLMRKNLDQGWWSRYVWAINEALMGFMGVMFVTAKIEAIAAAKLLAAEKAAGAAGATGSGVEQLVTQTMHENVWTTLKEMAQNGPQHLNLDNSILQELSQKVLDTNGMFEQEWVNQAVEGLKSSRTLPEGMPIKMPVEVLKVLGY